MMSLELIPLITPTLEEMLAMRMSPLVAEAPAPLGAVSPWDRVGWKRRGEQQAARHQLGALLGPQLHEATLRRAHHPQAFGDVDQLSDRVSGLIHWECYRNRAATDMSHTVVLRCRRKMW